MMVRFASSRQRDLALRAAMMRSKEGEGCFGLVGGRGKVGDFGFWIH